MKIAYVLSSVSRANGGVSESVRNLAQSVAAARPADEVAVLGLQDEFSERDAPLWHPLQPRCAPVTGPRAFGYAPGLAAALTEADADITHLAGLWMYPSVANHRWARANQKRYMISPHGMLDAWALENSRWKKRLAAGLFERRHLEQAACLHALCAAEAESIRAYGLTNPICVLPNGVDLPPALPSSCTPPWAGRFPAERKIMLFLGRLHPKKGLRPLLDAWARVRTSEWQLVIAGWDQGGHQRALEELVEARQMRDSVCFCGPLHGRDKAAAYAAAQAFTLPSHSEGLPMTVLEAWSYGVPVLMTAACNLPEGFAEDAAVEIATDPDTLAQALTQFFQRSEEDRSALGQRGRSLAARKFSWSRIADEMLSTYHWLAEAGPRPGFVIQ